MKYYIFLLNIIICLFFVSFSSVVFASSKLKCKSIFTLSSSVTRHKDTTNIIYSSDHFKEYTKYIKQCKRMSPEETSALFMQYQTTKDKQLKKKIKDSIINAHLYLVVITALKYKASSVPIMDLIQEGNLGLIQSLNDGNFDCEKGYFHKYAPFFIKAYIFKYMRTQHSLVKIGTTDKEQNLFSKFVSSSPDLKFLMLYEEKDYSKIANELKVSEAEVISMLQRIRGDISFDNTSETGLSLINLFASEGLSPEELVIMKAIVDIVKDKIAQMHLNPLEQTIIGSNIMWDDMTDADIGTEFGCTYQWVSQVRKTLMEKIKRKINNDKILANYIAEIFQNQQKQLQQSKNKNN